MDKPKEEAEYFHELSQETIEELVSKGASWNEIMEKYKQPEWCTHYQALRGTMGCWSLTDVARDGIRTKISHDYCRDCDCYKP